MNSSTSSNPSHPSPAPSIRIAPDADAVADQAAQAVLQQADAAIAARGTFTLALSGGSTPKALYEKLAAEPYRSRAKWDLWEIFFGDERCVPPDHADSNYRMARLAMLDHVPLKPAAIHRMRGEIDPQQAAREYGELLQTRFGDADQPGIDLVLLGMGDDGHTASLFPGTEALKETKHRVVANWVEKFNTWRITMTAPFINRSRQVLILSPGEKKMARIKEVMEGPHDPTRLPIQMIRPTHGTLTWMLDEAAAGK